MGARDASPVFLWRGRDRLGQAHSGSLRAAHAAEARAALRQQGIFEPTIQRQASGLGGAKRISNKDLCLLTRQLATLSQAGISMLSAFELAARSTRNAALRDMVMAMHTQIEQGSSLHLAFAQYPQYFDDLYCATVQSGEASGTLDRMLQELAQHMEKSQALRARIRSALTYPAMLALVTIASVVTIMVFMVPAFERQFASFGAPLPAITQSLIALSRTLAQHGWWMALLLTLLVIALIKIWRANRAGRARMDRWSLRIPIIGPLLRSNAVARWARSLATLSQCGLPWLEALQLVGRTAGHATFREATTRITHDIEQGSSLSDAMAATAVFPDALTHLCALGETSGTLDTMLARGAAMFEGEVDAAVTTLSSLLEPIMLVVLGLVIGGILLAMYLPIFQLGRVI